MYSCSVCRSAFAYRLPSADHQRGMDVFHVRQRGYRCVEASWDPTAYPIVIIAAEPVLPGEIRIEVLALQVAHGAFRDRGLDSGRVRDDPKCRVSAVRSAALRRSAWRRRPGASLLRPSRAARLRTSRCPNLYSTRLRRGSRGRAAARIGEHDVVTQRCVDLEFVEERIPELRLRTTVNVENRRVLRSALRPTAGMNHACTVNPAESLTVNACGSRPSRRASSASFDVRQAPRRAGCGIGT